MPTSLTPTAEWELAKSIAEALRDGKVRFVLKEVPKALANTEIKGVHALLYSCLGSAHQKRKDWAKSIEFFSKALELDPSLKWVWAARGASHMSSGKPELGLSDTNRNLEEQPEDTTGLYVRCCCYLILAKAADPSRKPYLLRRAIVDIDEAVALAPADAQYLEMQRELRSIGGVAQHEPEVDGWKIAEKIATVAGKFVGGALW